MRARLLLWLALTASSAILPLAACSSSATDPNALPTSDDDASSRNRADARADGAGDGDPGLDATPSPGRVYAHTTDTLYLFEPVSRQLSAIGKLDCLKPGEAMIDIAVDRTGAMYGTSFDRFFAIDPVTAKCTKVADATALEDYPNGMSFVPAGTVDKTKETLVGYATKLTDRSVSETYVKIDVQTGALTVIGNINADGAATRYRSSGDLVSLIQDGDRTYVTVRQEGDAAPPTDLLAEVDPVTGNVKRILGDTKQVDIFGFGYWAGRGYGFASDGRIVEIDMVKGTSTPIATLKDEAGAPIPWYGAGVTTQAPVSR